jgi:hypothetical protein
MFYFYYRCCGKRERREGKIRERDFSHLSQLHLNNNIQQRLVHAAVMNLSTLLSNRNVYNAPTQRSKTHLVRTQRLAEDTTAVGPQFDTLLDNVSEFLHVFQNGSGVRPASYPVGREDGHSPRTCWEVKETWVQTWTPPIRLHGVVLSFLHSGHLQFLYLMAEIMNGEDITSYSRLGQYWNSYRA